MKQMNKEELINYFIELLGDNHVLEKYLSIEEIRERLNENIKDVKYAPLEGNSVGRYDQTTGTFILDIYKKTTEKTMKSLIVHELIHALSNSKSEDENKITYKTGFAIRQVNKNGCFEKDENWFYKSDQTFRAFGVGLNEGIVQLLTSEILGFDDTDLDKGYEEEKDFSRVFLSMFGKENLINKFFSKVKTGTEINEPLKYLFAEELEKYPEILDTFVLSLKKFEASAVIKANSHGKLDEDEKKHYDAIKGNACDDIKKLIGIYLKHLNTDKDLQNKVEQILEALSEFHDNRINYKYGNLELELNTPELSNAVHNIVFDKNNDMELGKRINAYISLTRNWSTKKDKCKRCKNSIENYCIKKGIVDESNFSKSGMLAFIFETYFYSSSDSLKFIRDKDLRNILSNFSYKKVGSQYELLYQGADKTINLMTHSTWFNEDGKISEGYEICLGENGWNINSFNMPPEVDKAKAESLRIQLQKISDKSDKQFINAIVFGNNVIMNYNDETKSINRIVYTLDATGNLVLVPEEKTRRLTDNLEEEKIDRGISKYINTLRERSRAGIVLTDILFDFSMSRNDITIDELREILIVSKNELDIKINFSDVVDRIFSSNLDMTQEEKKDVILSIARDLELDDRYVLDTIDCTLRLDAEQFRILSDDTSDEILMQETPEIKGNQVEESMNEKKETEIKVGENKFENSRIWMYRFKNWYGFIDRMMENAKTTKLSTKLISIKSDIVRTINSIFKQRNNNQIEDEQRKDDKGR